MGEERRGSKQRFRQFAGKALKATIKAVIIYVIYFILWSFLAPVSEMIPGFQQTVEIFVMVYIFLMIIGELSAGTIFNHFFKAGPPRAYDHFAQRHCLQAGVGQVVNQRRQDDQPGASDDRIELRVRYLAHED